MGQFLNLSAEDQRLVIEQTAARVGWIASSVEKDFWVSWTLQQLFAMPDLAPHLTFKGGTSLSKAWALIDRGIAANLAITGAGGRLASRLRRYAW